MFLLFTKQFFFYFYILHFRFFGFYKNRIKTGSMFGQRFVFLAKEKQDFMIMREMQINQS